MSALLPDLRTEIRANLRLALPLIAAQLSFVSMGTVDTIFAGRLGASELAAVAVGSNVWFLSFVMFMGIGMAVSPIVAQRVGARQSPQEIGRFLRGTLLLSIGLGLLWLVTMWLAAGFVLDWLALDARTSDMGRDYLHALAWAGPPMCLCFFLRNGAEGHGLTRVPLLAGLVGLSVNAGFDWLLMYGRWGFPALGPEGAGWATVIASWAMVAVYAASYVRVPVLRELQLGRGGWPRLRREDVEVLRVGLPIAAIITAEAWLFCIGGLLMGRFGADTVAAHQIAINFASLCFMVPTAIGMATTVRVGHAAGAGLSVEVALRGRVGILLGVAFACMSALGMALAPGWIVALYTDVEHLAAPAVHFLAFAAVFQIFDCVQATANGALRGVKDTRLPMVITVLAYWMVGMPLAAGLAFATPVGPTGIWWGFIGGLAVAATGLSLRFLRGFPLR
ncbi:MAG: MATE family efflux transporter [Panacagrimonas sp.]